MARKLLCKQCDEAISKLADKYKEYYESIEGVSNGEYKCDDCGKDIPACYVCYAAVLLPTKNHFQYHNQKPQNWMYEYFL